MAEQILIVQVGEALSRLDKVLAVRLPGLTRSQIKKSIASGSVVVDGRPVKAGMIVKPGMEIRIQTAEDAEKSQPAIHVDLDVIYEDDDLIVINKQAGIVVHPAHGHERGTLQDALAARFPHSTQNSLPRNGIVHRLDKDTSGALLAAKTAVAYEALKKIFETREIQKFYLAIVCGQPPSNTGIIEAPIARESVQRKRMGVSPQGKFARTSYRIVKSSGKFSLLQVKLDTGRTHQIRVHLAWLGCPVLGDGIYGRRKGTVGAPRQMLHASEISFNHPIKNIPLNLQAQLPEDMQAILDTLSLSGEKSVGGG